MILFCDINAISFKLVVFVELWLFFNSRLRDSFFGYISGGWGIWIVVKTLIDFWYKWYSNLIILYGNKKFDWLNSLKPMSWNLLYLCCLLGLNEIYKYSKIYTIFYDLLRSPLWCSFGIIYLKISWDKVMLIMWRFKKFYIFF